MTLILRRTYRIALFCATLVLLVTSAQAQQARHRLITLSDHKSSYRTPTLSSSATITPLRIDLATFHRVADDRLLLAALPVAPGISVDLDLEEYNVVMKDAVMTTTGDDGVTLLPKLTTKVYRGKVAGDPESRVYLAIGDYDVVGSVVVRGKTYQINTDRTPKRKAGEIFAVSYPLADVGAIPMHCGVNDGNERALGFRPLKGEFERMMRPGLFSVPITVNFAVPGAFEGDYEYRQIFKDEADPNVAAADYMVQIVGMVSSIYENDMNCQIFIKYMNIYTSPDVQPYREGKAMELALFESRTFWRGNRGAVSRSFAHVFSGKPWTNPIGIAFLSVLCRPDEAMAYSLITRLGSEQDVTVVAHENGHMFGSVHTHSCVWNPAIDSCANAEGGSCFGPSNVKQSTGTIMSYCSAKEMRFHEKCATVIRNNLIAAGEPCVITGRKLLVQPHLTTMETVDVNVNRDTTIADFFQNPSASNVQVLDVKITGENAQRFSIIDGVPPFTLAPGESRSVTVRYNSPVQEPSFGTFTVEHDGFNPPVTVYFEAYAEDKQPNLGIRVHPVKRDIDFGTIRLGETRDTLLPRMFFNAGSAPVHVDSTWIIGPDRYDFVMTGGNGPFDIGVGTTSLAAAFRFQPTDTGWKKAYLVIKGNTRDRPYDTIALNGYVKRGPLLLLKINSLTVNFGEQPTRTLADTSFSQFFYNAGSDTLEVGADIYGNERTTFSSTLTGLSSLAPGESLDLGISMFDSTDGIKQAFMKIAHIRTGEDGFQEIYKFDTVWLIAFVGNWASVERDPRVDLGGLTVGPNPAVGTLTVTIEPLQGERGRPVRLRFIDVTGREAIVRTERFGSGTLTLPVDLSSLPAGTYTLSVESDAGRRLSRITIAR